VKPILNLRQRFLKRSFDVFFSFIALVLLWWLILLVYLIATFDTRKNGLFVQERVGRNGKLFNILKIRTMRDDTSINTTVTQSSDSRITKVGSIIRKTKMDELPQLFNVLIGNMSFVGPRPDVPGFADQLIGKGRKILTIRPGITGPATLAYRNEEEILDRHDDPETYNKEVIFPEKVRINIKYIEEYSFRKDLKYILATILPNIIPEKDLFYE